MVRSTYVTTTPPGRALGCDGVRPASGTEPVVRVRGGESNRGRATGVPFFGAQVGRTGGQEPSLHRDLRGTGYTGIARALQRRGTLRRPRFGRPERDAQPVTMAAETRRGETGAWGRPDRTRVLGARAPPDGRGSVPGRCGRGRGRPPAGPGRSARRTDREAAARMLRLLHTADVHLGARHADLGDAAATQRERQFAAFVATVDLAIAETRGPRPRRRRPVRLQRPAAPLRGTGRPRARPPRRRRGSARSSSRAPTTSTTAPRSTAPTTSRRWPARRRATAWSPS